MGSERRVDPNCANSSNPFHVCADYCAGKSSSHSQPRIIGGGAKSPVPKHLEVGGGRHVNPTCAKTSNPFHQCSDNCNGKTPDGKRRTQAAGKAVMVAQNGGRSKEVRERRHIDPSCVNASNPFHQCGDHCAKKQSRGGTAATYGEISELERRNVEEGMNLDPMEYYSPGSSGTRRLIKTNSLEALIAAESEKESKGVSSSAATEIEEESEGVNSSVTAEIEEERKGGVNSSVTAEIKEENEEGVNSSVSAESKEGFNSFVAAEIEEEYKEGVSSSVSAESKEGFNSFVTAEIEEEYMEGVSSSVSAKGKEGVTSRVDRKVDPSCRNASNPFHVCAEYCSQRSIDKGWVVGGQSGLVKGNWKVDPRCRNASNPFHVCADYCSNRSNGGNPVVIASGSKGSPKVEVQRRDVIASGSKGSPKVEVQRRDVDPRCVNAANPFHICAEYCFQKIREAR